MNHKLFVILCVIFSWKAYCLHAETINYQRAMQNASNFLRSMNDGPQKAKKTNLTNKMKIIHRGHSTKKGNPLYYVFGAEEGGYIIAAGDDCIEPILGYSNNNSFDSNDIPDNLQWWLDEYERQMLYAIEHGIKIHSAISNDETAIAPLLTSKWGQGEPYNTLCPIGKEGKRCPAGCIATAMAQIMYYHRWPESGTGSHSYTSLIDSVESLALTQSADFENTSYQWNLMQDVYRQDENSDSSKNAVATLLSHIGIALDMRNGSKGSSPANAKEAAVWKRYFKYAAKSMKEVGNDDFSNIVYKELQSNRPVFVAGTPQETLGGHAFVCDGYAGNGYFHINWGWYGNHDGYFLLTAMTPAAGHDYSYHHRIVYDIQPYKSEIPIETMELVVQEPGTLQELLDKNSNTSIAKSLKVSGLLNGTDILALRKLAGRDENNAATDGILTDLDLSEASIVDGGDCYFRIEDETYYKTQNGTKANVFPDQAFMSTNLRKIRLPESIETVGKYAFVFCYDLLDVDYGHGVKTLDFSCFNYSSMSHLTLPKQVKKIGAYAFCNMSKLERVCLNNELSSIGARAFEKDDNIISIDSEIKEPFAFNDNVFSANCYEQATLYVPHNTEKLYRQTSGWKNFIHIVEKGDDLDTRVPMLRTKWGQSEQFRQSCPFDRYGKRTPPGCGAVAVGQIVNYYRAFNHGFGCIKYDYTQDGIVAGTVDVDFSKCRFDWDNMLDVYPQNQYTSEQSKAVSDFLFWIGAAMRTQYRTGGSSPSNNGCTMWGLHHFLHFSKKSIIRNRRDYSTAEWIEMLNSNLQAHHPVYYASRWRNGKQNANHIFVVDGVDDNGLYCVNFGMDNSVANREGVDINVMAQWGNGILGGRGVCYNIGANMITDLYPVDDDDYIDDGLIVCQPLILNGDADRLEIQVSLDEEFSIGTRFQHYGITSSSLEYGLCLTDKAGRVVDYLKGGRICLGPGHYLDTAKSYSLPMNLDDGNYTMHFVTLPDGVVDAFWQPAYEALNAEISVKVHEGMAQIVVPVNHRRSTHLFLREDVRKVDNVYERYQPGTALLLAMRNPSISAFCDTLRLHITLEDEDIPFVYETEAAVYDGCDADYHILIPDTTIYLKDKKFSVKCEYKDQGTGKFLPLVCSTDENGIHNVQTGNETDATLYVYDLHGRCCVRLSPQAVETHYPITLKALPNGIYVVKQYGVSRKLAIQH